MAPLEIPEDPSNIICGWADCKESFEKRGNQRYCGKACSGNARLVQNRLNKRRQRRMESERRRMKDPKAVLGMSAVRQILRFRLLLRPLSRRRVVAGRRTEGLLLRNVPNGLQRGPPALAAAAPVSSTLVESG